jgi:hypothetical protein
MSGAKTLNRWRVSNQSSCDAGQLAKADAGTDIRIETFEQAGALQNQGNRVASPCSNMGGYESHLPRR